MVVPKGIFRAYDVRGKYPSEINRETVFKIGRALAGLFGSGIIVVARDGRLSSPELYQALIRGFSKRKLVKIGLSTTPMFYYLVQHLKATGGVIVTASHNPREWNGLKVVGRNAEMISGKEVLRIMNKES